MSNKFLFIYVLFDNVLRENIVRNYQSQIDIIFRNKYKYEYK